MVIMISIIILILPRLLILRLLTVAETDAMRASKISYKTKTYIEVRTDIDTDIEPKNATKFTGEANIDIHFIININSDTNIDIRASANTGIIIDIDSKTKSEAKIKIRIDNGTDIRANTDIGTQTDMHR